MDKNQVELIEKLCKDNSILRKLYDDHKDYEKKITGLTTRKFLTSAEELEIRKLKFRKLAGKDKMFKILASYNPSLAHAA